MLVDHLKGVLNDCGIQVHSGLVEAINGHIKTLLRRGRGYKTPRPDSSPFRKAA
jgi:transposase